MITGILSVRKLHPVKYGYFNLFKIHHLFLLEKESLKDICGGKFSINNSVFQVVQSQSKQERVAR